MLLANKRKYTQIRLNKTITITVKYTQIPLISIAFINFELIFANYFFVVGCCSGEIQTTIVQRHPEQHLKYSRASKKCISLERSKWITFCKQIGDVDQIILCAIVRWMKVRPPPHTRIYRLTLSVCVRNVIGTSVVNNLMRWNDLVRSLLFSELKD